MFLSIITPTYNRAYCLANIFYILNGSDGKDDFEWIIVDDGSSDETENIVQQWLSVCDFKISYVKKENGGKTNALVSAFNNQINGAYSVVLDSDDVFVENFCNILKQEFRVIDKNSDIIGLVMLKSDLSGRLIGTEFKTDIANYMSLYYGAYRTTGDKIFIVKTDVYKASLVPSFGGEKLIPESVFYLNMGTHGSFKCVNKVLYKGEYLDDGLSANVNKVAAKSIRGFILEKLMLQKQPMGLIPRIKNEVKYLYYSLGAGYSFPAILSNSNKKFYSMLLIVPVSLFLHTRIKVLQELNKKT